MKIIAIVNLALGAMNLALLGFFVSQGEFRYDLAACAVVNGFAYAICSTKE
jgi:hypothetical protein